VILNRYDYSKAYQTLQYGDTINIFKQSSFSYWFWPIDNNEIFEIDLNGQVLFDFKQVRDYYLMTFSGSFILLLFMIILYRFQKAKMNKSNHREIDGLLKP
jgi:hypothetical protein